eukprot:scaffold95966_cov40-Phaeocystis_antarctica.AAC.2
MTAPPALPVPPALTPALRGPAPGGTRRSRHAWRCADTALRVVRCGRDTLTVKVVMRKLEQ